MKHLDGRRGDRTDNFVANCRSRLEVAAQHEEGEAGLGELAGSNSADAMRGTANHRHGALIACHGGFIAEPAAAHPA